MSARDQTWSLTPGERYREGHGETVLGAAPRSESGEQQEGLRAPAAASSAGAT